jgi:hypothetical protein
MGRRITAMAAAGLAMVAGVVALPVAHPSPGAPVAVPVGPPADVPLPGTLTVSSTNYIGDPDVVAVPAARSPFHRAGYLLFSTSDYTSNVPTEWSTDLRSWKPLPDSLPRPPAWADRWNANTKTWAPSVMEIDGRYVMYVATRDLAAGRECIGVAVSADPAGPYRPVGAAPLVCQLALGGSIDPDVVQAPGGQLELAWKSDGDAIGMATALWSQPLTADGLSLEGVPHVLMRSGAAWEQGNVEAPTLVSAQGRGWWLFYSGSQWDRPRSYATGLAWCADLTTATCTPVGSGPWLATSFPRAVAPGGMDVFTTLAGRTEMAVSTLSWIRWSFSGHSWFGWNRNLLISPLDLGGDPVHTVDRDQGHLGRKAT